MRVWRGGDAGARVQVMPVKKVVGLLVAAAGIAWYTTLNLQPLPKRGNGSSTPQLFRSASGATKTSPVSSPTPAREA